MNKRDKEIIDHLEGMPFTEARRSIRNGTLHRIDSPDHLAALSWLEGKEAELRDDRENDILSNAKQALSMARKQVRWAKWATIIAAIAIIIAMIAAREDIMWLISWVIAKLKTS
jgi:hypothetical protein